MIKTIQVIDNFKDFVRNLTGPITEDQKDLICNNIASYERGECYCLESVHGYIEYCLDVLESDDSVTLGQYNLIVQAFERLCNMTDENLYISNEDQEIWCN